MQHFSADPSSTALLDDKTLDHKAMDRDAIARLLPHSGRMCLLTSVLACNETAILCRADDHRDSENPLRRDQSLPITAGIEYAAQAMALHATLTQKNNGSTRAMLIQLSNVSWTCNSLDHCDAPLHVRVEQVNALGSTANYRFGLFDSNLLDKNIALIEGNILVHFTAAND